MANIDIISNDHLKCDNTNCDYKVDVPRKEWSEWINKPCPKCGENLLTHDDYVNAVALHTAIDLINGMSPDEIAELSKIVGDTSLSDLPFFKDAKGLDNVQDGQSFAVLVSTHKDIKAVEVRKIDEPLNPTETDLLTQEKLS